MFEAAVQHHTDVQSKEPLAKLSQIFFLPDGNSIVPIGYARHPSLTLDGKLAGNPAIGAFPWFGAIIVNALQKQNKASLWIGAQ